MIPAEPGSELGSKRDQDAGSFHVYLQWFLRIQCTFPIYLGIIVVVVAKVIHESGLLQHSPATLLAEANITCQTRLIHIHDHIIDYIDPRVLLVGEGLR